MNTFFERTNLFTSYASEHIILLISFVIFMFVFIRKMKSYDNDFQRKVMVGIALLLSFTQLAKIPLNLYTGVFDVTSDIPLHMCNFLPFILVIVFISNSRTLWATIFFWIILGVSQANFTPSVEFSLFHYDSIRYWMVHMGLVLLGVYPAVNWGWELELKDVWRTVIWLNVAACVIYGFNILLGSNYLYVMGKPPGTTFFSLLPEWPVYIVILEVILVVWSLMVYGLFRLAKRTAQKAELMTDDLREGVN